MDSGISVTAVTTPALFTGPPEAPAQVVRVRIRRERPAGPLYVTVHGEGLTTPHPRILRTDTDTDTDAGARTGAGAGAKGTTTAEVAVGTGAAAPGELLAATARVATPDGRPLAELPFEADPARGGGARSSARSAGSPGLWVEAPDPQVVVAPGARGLVRARIGSTGVRSALTGRAYAVSPYGTWQLTAPAALPLRVPADGPVEVEFEVRPPLDTPPGEYWIAVKAACQGRIAYGPAIALRIPPRVTHPKDE